MRIPLHLKEADPARQADFAADMAALNPNGFRTPGKNGTSLVIERMIAAGRMTRSEADGDTSLRQDRKRERRAAYLDACRAQHRASVTTPGGATITGDAALKILWARKVEARRKKREAEREAGKKAA